MMTLESLGNLGEFVGAIGVVISLVYLARQMHQNTLSVRAASFNAMIQNSIRLPRAFLPGFGVRCFSRSRGGGSGEAHAA